MATGVLSLSFSADLKGVAGTFRGCGGILLGREAGAEVNCSHNAVRPSLTSDKDIWIRLSSGASRYQSRQMPGPSFSVDSFKVNPS